MSLDVVVVGSCMIDLFCYTSRLPRSGETVEGSLFTIGHGGKGANQCVAAAKLGAKTCFIARLGNDSFGIDYKNALKEKGVDTSYVQLTDNIASGMAQITVAENGANQIVIVPGANSKLVFEDVLQAKSSLMESKVAIFQCETPLDTSIATLQYIKDNRTSNQPLTIVNCAPAVPGLDKRVYTLADIFCVNETEALELTGLKANSVEEATLAAKVLLVRGCKSVIITLGRLGALVALQNAEPVHVSARAVNAVDTTGAGDAFIGALAMLTAQMENLDLVERVRRACNIATYSVLLKGTQSSFPSREQLPQELFVSH